MDLQSLLPVISKQGARLVIRTLSAFLMAHSLVTPDQLGQITGGEQFIAALIGIGLTEVWSFYEKYSLHKKVSDLSTSTPIITSPIKTS